MIPVMLQLGLCKPVKVVCLLQARSENKEDGKDIF
jgi:hypothetical protein